MAGSSELAEVGRGEIRPEVIELLCQLRGEPALTTEEIADIVDIPDHLVEHQLEVLRTESPMTCRVVGEGARLWYVDTG